MNANEISLSYSREQYEKDLESARENTAQYFAQLAAGLIEPGTGNLSGLQAPLSLNDAVSLFEVNGTGSIKLNASTDNVLAYFDPEASLRNGQIQIVVIERSGTTGLVTTTINVGRPTADFGAASVLASSFEVKNVSAYNLCAGSQTHALLLSHPSTLASLSQATLTQSVYDRTRDVMTIQSSIDGTKSIALTSHLGSNMTVTSNRVVSKESRGLYSARPTNSTQSGFPEFNSTFFTTPLLATSSPIADRTVFQSANISSTASGVLANPFRFDSRSIRVFLRVTISDSTTAINSGQTYSFNLDLLNESGQVISSQTNRAVVFGAATTPPTAYGAEVEWRIHEEVQPIANIVISYSGVAVDNASLLEAQVIIEVSSETADIADRPVHVVKLEGVNTTATLSFAADVAIAGLPAADNMFIASGKREQKSNLDIQMVRSGLLELFSKIDRVSTTSGHAFLSSVITNSRHAISENMKASRGDLQAFSFRAMGHSLRKIADVVKDVRHSGSELLKRASPALEIYSATGLPGSNYAALGVKAIKSGQRLGILEAMDTMY